MPTRGTVAEQGIAGGLGGRRGFVRDVLFLAAIALCAFVIYHVAQGDAAEMTAAFIRRVRAMGQPE